VKIIVQGQKFQMKMTLDVLRKTFRSFWLLFKIFASWVSGLFPAKSWVDKGSRF